MKLDYQLIFGIDKQIHIVSYSLISFFLGTVIILFSTRQNVTHRIRLTWYVLVIFRIVEEYRQYILPGRSAELLDAIANMIGVTIGLAIPTFFQFLFAKSMNVRSYAVYGLVLILLMTGLLYINQLPFITFEKSLLGF